jgi:hypothetical protein
MNCPMCQNIVGFLGKLGSVKWYRCDGCGWEVSQFGLVETGCACCDDLCGCACHLG